MKLSRRALSGKPDYRGGYLRNDVEAVNDQFLPRCSRKKSPMLVLDYERPQFIMSLAGFVGAPACSRVCVTQADAPARTGHFYLAQTGHY
ncbi:MAG: hypothetical protein CPSOU_1371 [uncultured Paraburkholderia sp.]|nr:MAG: hypothetical protein CPSOU_1371 [uncultured Paraburkholderia sp.]